MKYILAIGPEVKSNFNQGFRDKCEQLSANTGSVAIQDIDEAMKHAQKTLEKRKAKIKKPWITQATFDMISRKHQLEQTATHDELQGVIKLARKSKRKDWRTWVHKSVTKQLDIRDKWMGIKYIKQKHSPNLYEQANARGESVNLGDRAQAAADYLAEKQWGQPNIPSVAQGNYYTANRSLNNIYNLDNISLAELKELLRE